MARICPRCEIAGRSRKLADNSWKMRDQTPIFELQSSIAATVIVLFALGISPGVIRANAQSQSDLAKASPDLQSPAAKQGLDFSVGTRGLDSLSFNGQSLFRSAQSGELQPWKSVFRAVLDALLSNPSPSVQVAKKPVSSIDLAYPWGHLACAYAKKGETLTMRIEVSNTGAQELDELSLRLMELDFPSAPNGGTLEAGMFGFGFKGTTHPLYQYPSVADPQFVAPIVGVDFKTGALNFCSDDLKCSLSVPYSTNPPANTGYPFIINCRGIRPGETKTFNVSLRFGPADSRVQGLAHDVLSRYAEKYPFQIKWTDRRPIGAIFRASLLETADNSIKLLRDSNAQGMITWDPEGQEFLESCYYGDPRLTPILAPETNFKVAGERSAIDDYFEKFRAAGLKVGVCIRPQQISMIDGKPVQQAADDEHATQILKEKIAYAKRRWGCTLFYVDSTATISGPLNPDVFKAVAAAYPDVLLIPENESMRYFAYAAPFNSYLLHKVTSTPVGARLVYPKAFSVLMANDGDRPEDHDALVTAIRGGEILLFNCWYNNAGVTKIKKLYEEATPGNTRGSLSPLGNLNGRHLWLLTR